MTNTAAKHTARQRIWDILERENVSPAGVHGRIPEFVGAAQAAERLAGLDEWRAARVIKVNPDRAQLPVRVRALEDGKLVYMAVPRLASPNPFYVLDPTRIDGPFEEVATGAGAADVVSTVGVHEMAPVDLVVCGSVAVSRSGVRLGKGAGYSDIEVALLIEAGLVGADTTIVTTVHDLQLVDDPLPEAEHDFRVDVVVTPSTVVRCVRAPRPRGIVRDHLTDEQIRDIPVLRQ